MGKTKLSRTSSSKVLGVPISKQMWKNGRKGGELKIEKKIRKEKFSEEKKKAILQWIHDNTSGFQ